MPQQIFSDDELKQHFSAAQPRTTARVATATPATPPKKLPNNQIFSDEDLAPLHPDNQLPSTLLANRREMARQAFENALPTTDRTYAGGSLAPEDTKPDPKSFTGLPPFLQDSMREYLLRGMEQLGIDPGSPLKSSVKTAAQIGKGLGLLITKGMSHPIDTAEDVVKGGAAMMAAGPVEAATAKTPGETMSGLARTTSMTYAPLRAGVAAYTRGGPEGLMTRAADLRSGDAPTSGLVAWAGRKIPGGQAFYDAMQRVQNTRAGLNEWLAKKMAGKPSLVPPPTFPTEQAAGEVGYSEPGSIERTINTATEAEDEAARIRSTTASRTNEPPPNMTHPQVNVPYPKPPDDILEKMRNRSAWENTPDIGVGNTRAPAGPSQSIVGPKLTSQLPGEPGSAATQGETLGAGPRVSKPATSPATLFFKEIQDGIPPETMQLLGKGKLNSIARDAEVIMKEQGKSVLEDIDKMVGDKDMRVRMLQTSEGQETISRLTTALRQSNTKDMMWHSRNLEALKKRLSGAGKGPLPPPPA